MLSEERIDYLFNQVRDNEGLHLQVDLESQTVGLKATGESFPFDVDAFRKYCLLNGLDDIGLTLVHAEKIRAFERQHIAARPWLAAVI